jgi:hypothetical protein
MCNICEKNNVQANPVEFSSKFQESVWISVKLEGGDELLAGCIDRSNSGTDENNECLLKLLNEVNDAKYSHVLIMGDFNFEKTIQYRKSFHLHLTTVNQEREVHGQYVRELVYSHVDRGKNLLFFI